MVNGYGAGGIQAMPQAPQADHVSYAQDWAAARSRMDARRMEYAQAAEAVAIAEREERECWARLQKASEVAWEVAKTAACEPGLRR